MGIFDRWSQYQEKKRREGQQEAAMTEWIERMVQESDPSIREVEGYRRQLRSPLENALGHINGLVSGIPGPLSLSVDRWNIDPLIHALFARPDDIQSLL